MHYVHDVHIMHMVHVVQVRHSKNTTMVYFYKTNMFKATAIIRQPILVPKYILCGSNL